MDLTEIFIWFLVLLFGSTIAVSFPYLGTFFLVIGVSQVALYFLFSIGFEMRRPRLVCLLCGANVEIASDSCTHCGNIIRKEWPLVSVLVPAHNEENVIEHCFESVFNSDYKNLDVVVVDDGSTDSTRSVLESLSKKHMNVHVICSKKREGKASALNKALAVAKGSYIVTLDADTFMEPRAIRKLVANLEINPSYGAVCGYDSPSNLVNWLVKLLLLSTHTSTGFVRRALSYFGVLPVVNFGAFRRNVLDRVGEQRDKDTSPSNKVFIDSLGEDLEMTLIVHKLGYKTCFEPDATALSESPSNIRTLWNQRVRWVRAYIESIRLHREMLFKDRFGWFLAYLLLSTTLLPVILLVALVMFVYFDLLLASRYDIYVGWDVIQFFGLIVAFLAVVWGLAIDQALRKHWKYLWVYPLWVFYSVFLTLVSIAALVKELRGTPRTWDPWKKTGIINTVDDSRAR